MVLINNLTVDEINAALIHLQRSRNEVVGGEKGDIVQNITINNQGGGADYSSVINAIENRVKNTETNINTLDSSQRMLALETAGMQEQIADIYNTLLSMSQNNITDISWDDANRVLVINTISMSYEVAIPSETVALSLEGNVLTFTMGEQTTSVTLNYIPTSEKGAANGVATLDSSGRIPYSQLPESAMEFLGEWDASTNTPHLEDGEGDNGDFYVVSVGGTVNFGTQAEPRNITFYPNDRVVYEGSADQWFRLPAGEVRTVNGLSGDVVLNGTNVNYDGTNNSPTLKSKIDSVETKANTQADWNISDSSNLAYIKNKPALKTVAVTGSYNDLTNKPTIPAAQIQSDWTQTDSTKKDFIKHKIPIWITQGSASDNMQPVDVVQSGNTKPVTSGGVAMALNGYQSKDYVNLSSNDANNVGEGIYNCYRVAGICANIPVARIGLLTSYKYVSGQYIRITQEYSTNDDAVSTAEKYIRWGMSNNSGTSYNWSAWTKCSLPSPPSTSGKYVLQCTFASGVPTYSWSTKYAEKIYIQIAGGDSKKLLDYLPISSENEKYLITMTCLTVSYTKVYFGVVQTNIYNQRYYFTQLFNSGNVAVTTQNDTDGLITNNESYALEVSILKIL